MGATLKRSLVGGSDPLGAMGSKLAEKLASLGQPAKPAVLITALHELLDGQDPLARTLRTAVQIHLARVSNEGGSVQGAETVEAQPMLSTEEAAQLMGCSRPYVAMLIDAGKLVGGVKSKGGHRKVPKSSVLNWIEAAKAEAVVEEDSDYRKAGVEAGMYAVSDQDDVKSMKAGRRGGK
jgi:excisionase family DNA binding protein